MLFVTRRIFAAIVSCVLLTTLVLTQAYATDSKGLGEAIVTIRTKLDIPDELTEFDSNINQSKESSSYYVRWFDKEETKSVNATVNSFGDVTLPDDAFISWGQLINPDEIVTTITKNTVTTAYVNALSAIQNSDIYYFNYKNDGVKRNDIQKVGFIIGDGYNLDSRLLSREGDAIDICNAIGLNWRATQQLYEKIKKQQEKIDEILSMLKQS